MTALPPHSTKDERGPVRLEYGMQHLAAAGWTPDPIAPERSLADIKERRFEACIGRSTLDGVISTNVIERLVTAYGLLRDENDAQPRPVIMWETLEALGYEVGVDFAERGSDGYYLFQVICALEARKPVDRMQLDLAYQCLGRLWATAFSAPPGYDNFIAKSAAGTEKPELTFFAPLRRPEKLSQVQEARYMRRLLDMLQAAVFADNLPDAHVGHFEEAKVPDKVSWLISIPRGTRPPWEVAAHVEHAQLNESTHRYVMTLVEQSSGSTIGQAAGTVLEGESGSYDDFLDLAAKAGTEVESCVDSVFAADQVVSLYPRVREILDAVENQVFRLLVIERVNVAPHWRGSKMGQVLLEQLLAATDLVDLAIARPQASESEVTPEQRIVFGVQAGYARAKLKLAKAFAEAGAEFLISGTMGLRLASIRRLHARAESSRVG